MSRREVCLACGRQHRSRWPHWLTGPVLALILLMACAVAAWVAAFVFNT